MAMVRILLLAAAALLLAALAPASVAAVDAKLMVDTSAVGTRYLSGCTASSIDDGATWYEEVCYYQPQNKVCAGPDEVYQACAQVPGAAQSAVACAFWLEQDLAGYVWDQAFSPSVALPPVPPECV
ncbi:MAG: hypothetical protein QOI63_167 [Thermoplasmata archaeon]|jgi:hypothetical protein|nr:hypothetical protein [Thermoplasmata archaeon]